LKVTQSKLSPDKKTIHLTIPNIKPTWVMEIQYHIKDDQGVLREGLVQNTIHQLGEVTTR
jgi:transposase